MHNYNLPLNWRMLSKEEEEHYCDDGRDFDKPMFLRDDKLARIYFNDISTPDQLSPIAIAYDYFNDGDCCDTLEEAFVRINYRIEAQGIKNGKY